MQFFWFLWAGLGFLVAFLAIPLIARFAERAGVVARPSGHPKEVHKSPVPLLGGLAVFLGVGVPLLLILATSDALTDGLIHASHYLGFLLGGAVLMIGGFLDDKYNLPPKVTILFPMIAAATAVLFGIGVDRLTNPFGETPFFLADWQSSLLTFVWLMVVMYTTKFLDGLDGLASGVSGIGAFMMFLLAVTVTYFQPDVALFSLIAVGALAAFFVWNFHPAVIFLGEGGSTYVGFLLGVLSVIGGAKLGTLLLVLAIPFLDVLWVVLRRVFVEHKSPTSGDRKHLHHRLLDLGLSQRQVVVLYVGVAAASGMSTLLLQSRDKIITFGVIATLMIIAATYIVITSRKRLEHNV